MGRLWLEDQGRQDGGWWTQPGSRLWSGAGKAAADSKAAAGGPSYRLSNPGLQLREIKLQTGRTKMVV